MTDKHTYPYTLTTPEPPLQYEEFEGARFAFVEWPAQGIPWGGDKDKSQDTSQDMSQDKDTLQDKRLPRGRVLMVHGFGEYTRVQNRLMDNLAQHGYESFSFDQRGAGKTSPGKQKGRTDESHTMRDLEHFVARNLQECKVNSVPLFLWGHSMGGGIVLSYACQGAQRLQVGGYAASGPLLALHKHSQPAAVTRAVAPLLAKCLPRTRIDTGLDLAGITSDAEYRAAMAEDPELVPLYGTFRQIYDFLERGKRLDPASASGAEYVRRNFPAAVPVSLFHGACDTINDPAASKRFVEACPARDKTLRVYEGMRHSIFSMESEDKVQRVFADFVAWLDERVAVVERSEAAGEAVAKSGENSDTERVGDGHPALA